MKKAFLALLLSPVFAIAAPQAAPILQLSDGGLALRVPRAPGGECPARIATVSLVEVGRPNTLWASQKVAVPIEHKHTNMCTAVIDTNQWAGQLREGQRLVAHATIGRSRSAALTLTPDCSSSMCKLSEAGTVGEDIKVSQ